MEEVEGFQSTNINSLWLNNIFENLKNLEMMERNAREGCQSIMDYLIIPYEHRNLILADTQYKNLRFMISEIHLLLTDLKPVIDSDKFNILNDKVNVIRTYTEERKYFVKETFNINRVLVSSSLTKLFSESLDFISELKREIIKEISDILYIKQEKDNKKKW